MVKGILKMLTIIPIAILAINAASFITGFTVAMVVYAYHLMLGWLS